MNRMTPNMDPPDEWGSVEFKVDGHWFTWDSNCTVHIYCPEFMNCRNSGWRDGYVPIGEYTPPDEPEFDWRGPLTAYAREYLRTRAAADAAKRAALIAAGDRLKEMQAAAFGGVK